MISIILFIHIINNEYHLLLVMDLKQITKETSILNNGIVLPKDLFLGGKSSIIF